VIVGNGLVALAEFLPDFGSCLKEVGVSRRQSHGFFGVGQGFGILALLVIRPGSIVVSPDVIRCECNRPGVVSDGLIQQAPAGVNKAAIVPGTGDVGSDRDRPGEIGNGLIEKALPAIGYSPTLIGFGEVGFQRDCLGRIGDGFVLIPALAISERAIFVGVGEIGFERDWPE
jgi:hypothetical protein